MKTAHHNTHLGIILHHANAIDRPSKHPNIHTPEFSVPTSLSLSLSLLHYMQSGARKRDPQMPRPMSRGNLHGGEGRTAGIFGGALLCQARKPHLRSARGEMSVRRERERDRRGQLIPRRPGQSIRSEERERQRRLILTNGYKLGATLRLY